MAAHDATAHLASFGADDEDEVIRPKGRAKKKGTKVKPSEIKALFSTLSEIE